MEGVLACFDSENFFAFVHCWVHAYRNVPMGKKKKKRKPTLFGIDKVAVSHSVWDQNILQ